MQRPNDGRQEIGQRSVLRKRPAVLNREPEQPGAARGEDQVLVGDEADFYGIGYVYTPAKWIDLYAALKQHTLDRSVGGFQDVNILMVGSRARF